MSYNVLDIARYVVNYSQKIGYPVSNLKLQKLLYFIQGFFLALAERPCFDEEIEAWGFGPVVPKVYQEFKMFGANNIPTVESIVEIDKNDMWNSRIIDFNDSVIDDEDKKVIERIVEIFKNTSSTALVNMTHNQDPWRNVYNPDLREIKIDKESIKNYFLRRYCKHDN